MYPNAFTCVKICPNASECAQMRSNLSKCVHMCPNATPDAQMRSHVSKLSKCAQVCKCIGMHPNSFKCVQMHPDVSECGQISNVSKCVQMRSKVSKSVQIRPNTSKCFPMRPSVSKCFFGRFWSCLHLDCERTCISQAYHRAFGLPAEKKTETDSGSSYTAQLPPSPRGVGGSTTTISPGRRWS